MPGGRLTYDDRQRIAAGLAEGLGYAAIARRLQRPTSTVSREVGRNGGYCDYCADTAQRATGRRARRVQGRPPSRASVAVRDFEEQFAAMMAQTGLPRMPARVLGCLLVSEHGSLVAAELIHLLQVSPASVSKAINYLESLELIKRERAQRRERYFVGDDIWYRAYVRQVQVCATWASAARHGANVLGGTPSGARLDEMSQYFEHVGRDLANSAEHWREVFGANAVEPAGVHRDRS